MQHIKEIRVETFGNYCTSGSINSESTSICPMLYYDRGDCSCFLYDIDLERHSYDCRYRRCKLCLSEFGGDTSKFKDIVKDLFSGPCSLRRLSWPEDWYIIYENTKKSNGVYKVEGKSKNVYLFPHEDVDAEDWEVRWPKDAIIVDKGLTWDKVVVELNKHRKASRPCFGSRYIFKWGKIYCYGGPRSESSPSEACFIPSVSDQKANDWIVFGNPRESYRRNA